MLEYIVHYYGTTSLGWIVTGFLLPACASILFLRHRSRGARLALLIALETVLARLLSHALEYGLIRLFGSAPEKEVVNPLVYLSFILIQFARSRSARELARSLLILVVFYAVSITCLNAGVMAVLLLRADWLTLPVNLLSFAGLTWLFSRCSLHRPRTLPPSCYPLLLMMGGMTIAMHYILDEALIYQLHSFLYKLITDGMLIVLCLAAYIACYLWGRAFEEKQEATAKSMRMEAELRAYEAAQASLESLRKLRHDEKNTLLYIQELISKGQYDALAAYCAQVTERFERSQVYVDCGNRVLNNVLNLAAEKARLQGIGLNAQVAVPEEISIPESDLCALLLNLLDNAIEACQRLGKDRRGDIAITIRAREKHLVIRVDNPCEETPLPPGGALPTSKADRAMHGLGLKIIQDIAEKYGGISAFSAQNGMFRAEVMLTEKGG